MTRETKLGAIVAGAFLSMVGGVVALKYTAKPAAPAVTAPEVAQATAQEQVKPAALEQHGPGAEMSGIKTPHETNGIRAPHEANGIKSPPEPAPTISGEIPLGPIRSVNHETPIPVAVRAPIDVPIPVAAPMAPAIEPTPDGPPKITIVTPPADPVVKPPSVEITPKDDQQAVPPKKESAVPSSDPIVLGPLDFDAPPKKERKSSRTEKIDPRITPPPPPDAAEPIVPPPPPGKDDFASSPMKKGPTSAKEPAPAIGYEPKKETPPPAIDVFTPPGFDAPPAASPPKNPMPDSPIKIDPPAAKKDPPAVAPPTKLDLPAVSPPMRVDPIEKKNPPATIDFDASPKKGPSAPAASGPSGAGGAKQDSNYDEDLHTLQPKETYRSLSKQYYNSDAYATALQRYNRDHPGQADYVRIPPIWVLEKNYAGEVAGGSAAPTRPVNYSPPASAEIPRTVDPVYTVAENGEMLAEIARKTLGTKDAWQRLWDANKQLNPAELVPGGTRLRLPEGARAP